VKVELLRAIAPCEEREQRQAIGLAQGQPCRERRLAPHVGACHLARPLSALPLREPRAIELCHLGGVGSIDEIAHDREPRAARQADVEPIHVHAHERGVRGLDRRQILL